MTLTRVLLLGAAGTLAGCGGAKDPTFWVHCRGSIVLSGAKSIDVTVDPTQGPVLSFPDPANPGKIGIIPITKDTDCTISPTATVAG